MQVSDRAVFDPLWKAAKKGDAGALRSLLSAAPRDSHRVVNMRHPRQGLTLLMVACKTKESGKTWRTGTAADVVALLLEYGADVSVIDAKRRSGFTALHYAAASDQVRSVETLLQAGASPFALSMQGLAPIDVARWYRSARVLEVLTSRTRVRSGWLYVTQRRVKTRRDGNGVTLRLHRWHKRFCVALAGNLEATRIEMAIYRDEASTRPEGLVFLTVGDNMLLPSSKMRWRDRPNMFAPDRPLAVRNPTRVRKFSRSLDDPQQVACGAAEMATLQFAAASPEEQQAWMALLQGAHLTSVPVGMRFPASIVDPPMSTMSVSSVPPPTMETPMAVSLESPLFGSAPASTMDSVSMSVPMSPPSVLTLPSPDAVPITTADLAASSPMVFSDLHATRPEQDESAFKPSAPSLEGSLVEDEDLELAAALSASRLDHVQRPECIVCMDAPRDAICVPCGHVAGCLACLTRLVHEQHVCPICRAHVDTVVKVYEC